MKIHLITILIFIFFLNTSYVKGSVLIEKDTTNTEMRGKVFGNIFTGFYIASNNNIQPKAAFQLSTALLGYSKKVSNNVSAIIIYDVYKTTNIDYEDSAGINNYFEGSNYTGFLKMAEIDWQINDYIELSVGQMLNEQYLTVQDKFWGYRYIAFTFQEIYRFGKQADFGGRVKFGVLNKRLKLSFTAVNGEGPFYYQDNESNFLFSLNCVYNPNEKLIFKMYTDYKMPPNGLNNPRYTISGFLGYREEKFKIGAEYCEVINEKFQVEDYLRGGSIYASYIMKRVELLTRYDYIHKGNNINQGQYFIAGVQYQPAQTFYTSINARYNHFNDYTQLFINFGAKF